MCVSQVGRARHLRSRRASKADRHAVVPTRAPHGHTNESARPRRAARGRSGFRGATTTPETDPDRRNGNSMLGTARSGTPGSTFGCFLSEYQPRPNAGRSAFATSPDNRPRKRRFFTTFRLALRLSTARPAWARVIPTTRSRANLGPPQLQARLADTPWRIVLPRANGRIDRS